MLDLVEDTSSGSPAQKKPPESQGNVLSEWVTSNYAVILRGCSQSRAIIWMLDLVEDTSSGSLDQQKPPETQGTVLSEWATSNYAVILEGVFTINRNDLDVGPCRRHQFWKSYPEEAARTSRDCSL